MSMKKLLYLLLWCIQFSLVSQDEITQKKIGLLIVATGKYINYVKPLIASAHKYFCTNHKVTYFVFTDGQVPEDDTIVRIEQKRLGWPYDTMMRIAIYHKNRELLKDMDYLFATDADMLFVDTVGDEILSDRVATQHPGFIGKRGTYESRKESTAYIGHHEGRYYFAGGFNGGSSKEFLKMVAILSENIEKDLSKNIIAIWHDESHINRYFIDNPPTCILSPSYCYPENWNLPYHKRLLALDKNHKSMRE